MWCDHWDTGVDPSCPACRQSVRIQTERWGEQRGVTVGDAVDDVEQMVWEKLVRYPANGTRGSVYGWVQRIVEQQWSEYLEDEDAHEQHAVHETVGEDGEPTDHQDRRSGHDVDDVELRILEDRLLEGREPWEREAWQLNMHDREWSMAKIGRAVDKSPYHVRQTLNDLKATMLKYLDVPPRPPKPHPE